jgi:hypothetical protein
MLREDFSTLVQSRSHVRSRHHQPPIGVMNSRRFLCFLTVRVILYHIVERALLCITAFWVHPTSALGQKRRPLWRPHVSFHRQRTCSPHRNGRHVPIPAVSRCSKISYSITSSARPSIGSGIVSPSALAVLRLMTSSIFVTCCTGRSAAFSSLRMRPVLMPTWRNPSSYRAL